jgi:uncharacterized protein (TIGR02217 family)
MTELIDNPDVFPLLDGCNFFSQKSPFFPDTIVRTSATGREVRVSLSDIVRWKFKVGYDYLREDVSQHDLKRIFAFFCQHIGQFGTFYLYDPTDHTVGLTVFGTGTGIIKTFQLIRMIGEDTVNAFSEPVYIVYGTPTVTINGIPTTNFTIGSFGAITFDSAPASGAVLRWSGQFMFLCHFSADNLDAEQMTADLWTADGLEFESWCPL